MNLLKGNPRNKNCFENLCEFLFVSKGKLTKYKFDHSEY